MKKYFANCKNLEELKKAYKELCKKYHPDNGGDNATMGEIITEYKAMFEVLKKSDNAKAKAEGKKQTSETAEMFVEILEKIIFCEGLDIEICGSWVWVSGNTYTHKETLKNAGFQFSGKYKKWYWFSGIENTEKKHKSDSKNFEEIREKNGSEKVDTKTRMYIKG